MTKQFVYAKVQLLKIDKYKKDAVIKVSYLDENGVWQDTQHTLKPGEGMIIQDARATVCPSCLKLAPDQPATWRKLDPVKVRNSLSRHDNETYICQICGGAEAMADYYEIDEARAREIIVEGYDLAELKLKRRE